MDTTEWPEWLAVVTGMVYRLATYTTLNVIDDAAMLSLIFV